MTIFLKMVNVVPATMGWKIKSLGSGLAAMGGRSAAAALQARDCPALMTGHAHW
jgi:hypothetical protein